MDLHQAKPSLPQMTVSHMTSHMIVVLEVCPNMAIAVCLFYCACVVVES